MAAGTVAYRVHMEPSASGNTLRETPTRRTRVDPPYIHFSEELSTLNTTETRVAPIPVTEGWVEETR